jgi:hypothetical protein
MPFYSIYFNKKRIGVIDRYSDIHGVSRRNSVNLMRDVGLVCLEYGVTVRMVRDLGRKLEIGGSPLFKK